MNSKPGFVEREAAKKVKQEKTYDFGGVTTQRETENAKKPIEYSKLAIFDLDGVLVETRDMHFEVLNKALIENRYPPIPRPLHLSTYDGLPTMTKLRMLGIAGDKRQKIWEAKQMATAEALRSLPYDDELVTLFERLNKLGIRTAVASNSIQATTRLALEKLGLLPHISLYVSATEDIPKPSPSMYWSCMKATGASAKQTVILEDSHVGQVAAVASGATLLPVKGRHEVKESRILAAFPHGEPLKYWLPELNIVIPMAGEGSRFAAAGYTFPKPLIEVEGKPMIQRVVENLQIDAKYIFLVRAEHYETYQLKYMLNLMAPGCAIIQVPNKTEGAACTVLAAKDYIDNDAPLLVVNSDQLLEWNPHEVMHGFESADAGIVTFTGTHPKWSYVRRNDDGFVVEVAEKKVISDEATCGLYFWKSGAGFVRDAEAMIAKGIKTNDEYYLAPVLNETIERGAQVRATKIEAMHGLGDPESLRTYLAR